MKKPAHQKRACSVPGDDRRAALQQWFEGEVGQGVRAGECAILAAMVGDLFGYRLVQLEGAPLDEDCLQDCSIRHRIHLSTAPLGKPASIRGEAHRLPIASDSIDAVILPHTLDFSLEPHQILREVERILIPEGRILIIGFNPFSLWGLWRLFLRWQGRVPWCGDFMSYQRLEDWLSLLGFDIERTNVSAFVPPLPQSMRRRLSRLDRLGCRIWPMLAGVRAVRAVKRVSTLRPVGRIWKPLRVLRPRTVEPTVREANDG